MKYSFLSIICPKCGERFSTHPRNIKQFSNGERCCPHCDSRIEASNGTALGMLLGVTFAIVAGTADYWAFGPPGVRPIIAVLLCCVVLMPVVKRLVKYRVVPSSFQPSPELQKYRRLASITTCVGFAMLALGFGGNFIFLSWLSKSPTPSHIDSVVKFITYFVAGLGVTVLLSLVSFVFSLVAHVKAGKIRSREMEALISDKQP